MDYGGGSFSTWPRVAPTGRKRDVAFIKVPGESETGPHDTLH